MFRLLQKMLEDGSPLVRKELVVTMQYVVKSFPNNFIILMKAIADEEEDSNMNLGKSGSTSMMTLTRVSSEDKLSRQMKMQRRSVGGSVT